MTTNLKPFNVKAGLSVGASSIEVIDDGGNATFGAITGNYIKTTINTVSTLESASTVGAGARSFVSDSDTTTFGSIVVGGGSNIMPVWSNGTNWLVG